MRRRSRISPPGRTFTLADQRAGLGDEKVEMASRSRESFLKAEELSSMGKWLEAAQACREGLAQEANNLSGLVLLGTALWKIGEVEEAEKALTLARGELERHAPLYGVLSEIFQFKGDLEGAEKMRGLHRALSQAGSIQSESPSSNDALGTGGHPAHTGKPVLKRLIMLAEAFQNMPAAGKSNHCLFTDNDRRALIRILRNS